MAESRRLQELAGCLKKASNLCDELALPTSGEDVNNSRVNHVSSIVSNARTLISASYRNGNFSRLTQRQRLRATTTSVPKKKSKSEELIPMEFVLLYNLFIDEEAHYPVVFSEENIAIRGFIEVTKDFSEKQVRDCLASAVNVRYPQVASTDFEFIKAIRRKLNKPITSSQFQFDYKQLKVLTGQGSLYIKLKDGFDFLLGDDDTAQKEENIPISMSPIPNGDTTNTTATGPQQYEFQQPLNPVNENINVWEPVSSSNDISLDSDPINSFEMKIKLLIGKCKHLGNPVEILALMQKDIVKGRKLELKEEPVVDLDVCNETNFIVVDRQSVLSSALEEMKDISDFRTTLEVSFLGEASKDLGGPRKEFFRLALKEIQERYFPDDKLLNENVLDLKELEAVGVIISLSVLQNGPTPKFLKEDLLLQLFSQDSSSAAVSSLRKGMDTLGIIRIGIQIPLLVHLFRKNGSSRLSRKKLIDLLSPEFSEEGTNRKQYEMKVYSVFTKFCREAASGRVKDLRLEDILMFATGADDEPILGFTHNPSIHFSEREYTGNAMEFVPSSHTCSNTLVLYIPNHNFSLPKEDELFEVYRLAFLNKYFGVI